MLDPSLFAFGCGVTFLFLGGVYIVLRNRFAEIHGVKSRPEEIELPLQAPVRHELAVVSIRRTVAARSRARRR